MSKKFSVNLTITGSSVEKKELLERFAQIEDRVNKIINEKDSEIAMLKRKLEQSVKIKTVYVRKL